MINEMLFIKRLQLNLFNTLITLLNHTKSTVLVHFTCRSANYTGEINSVLPRGKLRTRT